MKTHFRERDLLLTQLYTGGAVIAIISHDFKQSAINKYNQKYK